jgi:hypothetical protein
MTCATWGARRPALPPAGRLQGLDRADAKELAVLRILYGACATALDAFRAADNPVDEQLVADLEASAYLASPPGYWAGHARP